MGGASLEATPFDPELVDKALAAAERAVRRCQDTSYLGKAARPTSPPEALEEILGPLDWSMDGDGFTLLRRLLERIDGSSEPVREGLARRHPERYAAQKYEARYARGLDRLARGG